MSGLRRFRHYPSKAEAVDAYLDALERLGPDQVMQERIDELRRRGTDNPAPPAPQPWSTDQPIQRRSPTMPATSANKAILGAIAGGLAYLVATLSDRTSLDSMRVIDWVIVLLSAILAGLAVYVVPNRPRV